MALIDYILISAVWVASAVRFANTTGTPVVSAIESGTGEALADDYTLTASAVSGGTGTFTVGTASPNNPYKGRVVTGVSLDGATAYKNVIPGVTLVFNAATANGNVATVHVGQYLGTFDAFGSGAGTPGTAVRHRVVNSGTGAVSNAVASLRTHAVLVKRTGTVFNYVRPFAPGATEKVASLPSTQTLPYHLTIANVAGSGPTKTADLQVDTVTLGAASILNLSTGATEDGAGLKAISPAYPYRIITGPLTGLEFALDPTCANGDFCNILIFPARYLQITGESSPGVADAAGWGTTDVPLTQAGQAAGVIQPTGEAFYWARPVVPAGAGSESNPHPANVALSATETGAADWMG
jgi:hypothetical protein